MPQLLDSCLNPSTHYSKIICMDDHHISPVDCGERGIVCMECGRAIAARDTAQISAFERSGPVYNAVQLLEEV